MALPAGIVVGGIYLFTDHDTNENKDTSNIRGNCTVTDVNDYAICSDDENSTLNCNYNFTKVKYTVNKDNDSTIFPCEIGTTFQEKYKKKPNITEGTKLACYTNPECDYISMSKDYIPDDDDGDAGSSHGALYVVWIILLLCCIALYQHAPTAIIECIPREKAVKIIGNVWNTRHDWRKGCCCLCIEYKGYKQGKNEYYKYQWNTEMNDDDRFDYVMSNWINKYGKYKYEAIDNNLVNGISVDIESIIYSYLY